MYSQNTVYKDKSRRAGEHPGEQHEFKENINLNDESSLYMRESATKTEKTDGNGFVDFKVPQVPAEASSLPMSLRPVQQANEPPQLKKNKVFSELKVFSNLSNLALSDHTVIQPSELPKYSTPILTDVGTQAILNARRKQLLNAKLDLTINTTHQQQHSLFTGNYQPGQQMQAKVEQINLPSSIANPIQSQPDKETKAKSPGKSKYNTFCVAKFTLSFKLYDTKKEC